MEISNGIHRIDGLTGVNAYFIIINGEVTVIDTGMPGKADKIIKQIKSQGKSEDDIKQIVITHADIDHCGSAADLQKLTGAKVAIHEEDAPSMSGERDLKKVEGLGKLVIKAMTSFMSYKPIKPDIILKDGDEIGGMKVYHVPGHTPGSICLYKKDEAVFTGDTIITALTGKPRGPVKIFTLDMDKAWKSVEMISKLDFNLLLPGHGKPVKKDASSKVKQLQR